MASSCARWTTAASSLSLCTPDRTGTPGDIVLGFDSLGGYLATIAVLRRDRGPLRQPDRARHASRWTAATYHLAINNGPNALHGGLKGFDKVVWHGSAVHATRQASACTSRYTSADGERGIPRHAAGGGHLHPDGPRTSWSIDYLATTDKATPVNLTQHTYFNLAGDGAGDVLDAPGDDRRRPLHADRFDADSHRRAGAGRGHAVRFPHAPRRSAPGSRRTTCSCSTPAATITTSC